MALFMVCRDPFLLIGNHTALLFSSDTDLDKGTANVRLCNKHSCLLGRIDSALIEQILQVRPCKSGCRLRDLAQIYIVPKRFGFSMNGKNFESALYVRSADKHLPIKPSRTQDRRVKDIHAVGRRHHDNPLVSSKAVHLYKELVQCLLSLIVAAAHTSTSSSRHCVDLIDKNNTWRIFLGIFKEISHSGCTYSDKHLYKIRTGNREKRDVRLPCHCLCKQCLTGSRRPLKKHSLRYSGSHLNISLRVFQEIHDFLQLFLLFFQPSHIVKCHFLILVSAHSCAALPKTHGFCARSTVTDAALSSHKHKDKQDRRHHDDGRKDRRQKHILPRYFV